MASVARRLPETGLQVVLVWPLESEAIPLRLVLSEPVSSVRWFPTCRAVLAFLRTHSASVVISNAELPDGGWKDLLTGLSQFAHPPNLIVSSRLADESLWAEVLNLGAYDVLLLPFDPEEVRRVCSGAWRSWDAEAARPGISH